MKINNAFCPVSEKYVKAEVKLMSWSPIFDSLAVATVNGELLLYRLVSKERIWGLPVPDAGVGILSICWRPDGKLIAVSYDSAKHGLHFIAMEKPTRIRKFTLKKEVTATVLEWTDIDCTGLSKERRQELTSNEYLPKIPVWEFESKEKAKNFKYLEKGRFNILLVCDSSCYVTLLANGIFPIIRIGCAEVTLDSQVIIAARMTSGMEILSVVQSCGKSTHFHSYDLACVRKNLKLFEEASDKAYEILWLETYLTEILDSVSEQCDMVAQEMDSLLVSYLTKTASLDQIGDDFMQLLMWGKPTLALTDIFTNHMTKRGIKKLGTLIESSYTSIQQDLTLNFQNSLMDLYYHLTEMRGMVANEKQVLPFNIKEADELISTAGSLLLKTAELLHAIDTSLKNFKAFFRWLYISMLKIQDEPVDKLGNVSMTEMAFVADFIHEHFSSRGQGEKKSRHFQLEKVNQYFKDEPLSAPTKSSQNEWLNFVSSSSILSNCKSMVQPYPELSLCQIFKVLSSQLDEIVKLPKFSQNQKLNLLETIELPTGREKGMANAEFWTKIPKDRLIASSDASLENGIYILFKEIDVSCEDSSFFFLGSDFSTSPYSRALRLHIRHSEENLTDGEAAEKDSEILEICDFAAYNEASAICLLKKQKQDGDVRNFLAQVDLSKIMALLDKDGVAPEVIEMKQACYSGVDIPSIDISEYCVDVRDLGNKEKFSSVAASGRRNVSCVLSSNRHIIQPFLLDGTEEEDESVLDADKEE